MRLFVRAGVVAGASIGDRRMQWVNSMHVLVIMISFSG